MLLAWFFFVCGQSEIFMFVLHAGSAPAALASVDFECITHIEHATREQPFSGFYRYINFIDLRAAATRNARAHVSSCTHYYVNVFHLCTGGVASRALWHGRRVV